MSQKPEARCLVKIWLMLNEQQQKLVEDSIHIVPKVISSFVRKYACLRQVAKVCDLESAAYLALCNAARTYDPNRENAASPATYFYRAIHNGLLREVQKEINTNAHSIARIPLEELQNRQKPSEYSYEVAMNALDALSPRDRDWVERYILYGSRQDGGYAAFSRESGIDQRRIKKIILELLETLSRLAENHPHS